MGTLYAPSIRVVNGKQPIVLLPMPTSLGFAWVETRACQADAFFEQIQEVKAKHGRPE